MKIISGLFMVACWINVVVCKKDWISFQSNNNNVVSHFNLRFTNIATSVGNGLRNVKLQLSTPNKVDKVRKHSFPIDVDFGNSTSAHSRTNPESRKGISLSKDYILLIAIVLPFLCAFAFYYALAKFILPRPVKLVLRFLFDTITSPTL
jgi:hypothetical protein